MTDPYICLCTATLRWSLPSIRNYPKVVPRTAVGASGKAAAGVGEACCIMHTANMKCALSVGLSSDPRGLQVGDSSVLPTNEGRVVVMPTDSLDMVQHVYKDRVVRTESPDSPAELIDSPISGGKKFESVECLADNSSVRRLLFNRLRIR